MHKQIHKCTYRRTHGCFLFTPTWSITKLRAKHQTCLEAGLLDPCHQGVSKGLVFNRHAAHLLSIGFAQQSCHSLHVGFSKRIGDGALHMSRYD